MSADGAIQDGRIVAIGEVGKDAPGIVDAGGLALMPGIIASDGWKPGLVGGLIYSGPGAPSDGSAPSFSVSLNPDPATGRKHIWSIHT
jgi:hypothetical protein